MYTHTDAREMIICTNKLKAHCHNTQQQQAATIDYLCYHFKDQDTLILNISLQQSVSLLQGRVYTILRLTIIIPMVYTTIPYLTNNVISTNLDKCMNIILYYVPSVNTPVNGMHQVMALLVVSLNLIGLANKYEKL